MPYSNMFSYNIGLLGPSGIGKTSLLTSIFLETQLFEKQNGLRFSLYPTNQETSEKIKAASLQFDRAVALKEFNPIPGSSESSKFEVRLELQNGDLAESFDIDFMDYRGGDLLKDLSQIETTEWFRKMVKSRDLFVPIDAVVIMEYVKRKDSDILASLGLARVEEIIKRWAENMDDSSPYTLAFVPIKVETYSASDNMKQLRDAIFDLYYSRIKDVLEGKPNLIVQFNPVETYGCVELEHTDWKPPVLTQKFKIVRKREDEKITPSIQGAANLMLAIFRKRHTTTIKVFEKRISELKLKLNPGNKFVKMLIDKIPFVLRGTKQELAAILSKKEYYEEIMAKLTSSFEKTSSEIWKEMK